jgi:peroxiredoxin
MGLAFGTCVDASDGFSARFTFVVGPDGTIEQAIETKSPGGQAEQLVCSLRDHQ